jgi:hypothetical protein
LGWFRFAFSIFRLFPAGNIPEDSKDDHDIEMEHGEMIDDDDTNENIDHQGHDH